jgi:peptidoglycan/LPS O-acetylase OafA/YrhL
VAVYLLSLIATVLLAYLSYTFFESPFLRIKERFARIKSRATKMS